MKKFIFIISVLFLIIGCSPKVADIKKVDDVNQIFDEVIHFEYDGHRWTWFRSNNGGDVGYDGGIVHDFDCYMEDLGYIKETDSEGHTYWIDPE
jgi:hypothetical protein